MLRVDLCKPHLCFVILLILGSANVEGGGAGKVRGGKRDLLLIFLSVALIFFFFSSVAVSFKTYSWLQFAVFQHSKSLHCISTQRLAPIRKHPLPRGLSSFSGPLSLIILTSSLCSSILRGVCCFLQWLPPWSLCILFWPFSPSVHG